MDPSNRQTDGSAGLLRGRPRFRPGGKRCSGHRGRISAMGDENVCGRREPGIGSEPISSYGELAGISGSIHPEDWMVRMLRAAKSAWHREGRLSSDGARGSKS